jgi:hypothetical protein
MIVKGRHERTQMADIINPVNGYRGQLSLAGMTPKDHRKDNLNFIKAKQEEIKHRLEEDAKPRPEPFKLKKFAQVQSKISSIMTVDTHAEQSVLKPTRPSTAKSVRSKNNSIVAFGRTSHPDNLETPYPGENENDINLINTPAPIDLEATIEKHKSFGKVPNYLERIKHEMEMTKEKREEERAKARMPPGTRLMTEEERIITLEELHRQKLEISDLLFSLPLSLKTESLKMRKRELESKLLEIERAVTTFSRKIVYIKDDGKSLNPRDQLPVEVAF